MTDLAYILSDKYKATLVHQITESEVLNEEWMTHFFLQHKSLSIADIQHLFSMDLSSMDVSLYA